MLILAIDTTGFSTSLALVKDGRYVLYNKVRSNFAPNKEWPDFIKILPSKHQRFLLSNVESVLEKNNLTWNDVDAVAVSAFSGIYPCVVVGCLAAEMLARYHKKPLIRTDHIVAHTYSTWLERDPKQFNFPILIFSASGSHSSFSLIKDISHQCMLFDHVPQADKKGVNVFMGVGKVFHQAGKLFGIITPSDAGVVKFMDIAKRGNPNAVNFAPYYKGGLMDLDFSDFMEAVEDFWRKKKSKISLANIAASFQKSVMEIIINKILELARVKETKEIHIAGGLSEDAYLRKSLTEKTRKMSLVLRWPAKKYFRLDNAAMIGATAYLQKKFKIKLTGFEPKITS